MTTSIPPSNADPTRGKKDPSAPGKKLPADPLEVYLSTLPLLQRARYYDHAADIPQAMNYYMQVVRLLVPGCPKEPTTADDSPHPLQSLLQAELQLTLGRLKTLEQQLRARTEARTPEPPHTTVLTAEASMGSALSKEDEQRAEMRAQILRCIVTPDPSYTLKGIKGLNNVIAELYKVIYLPLEHPHLLEGKLKPNRAALLYGPPGCGKTLLMKTIAADSQFTVFNVSAALLLSKWHGESQKMPHVLYETAQDYPSSIVFIDEFDGIFPLSRKDSQEGDQITRQLEAELRRILCGMDTPELNQTVTIVATNRPWLIGDALRRRFEKILYVPPPNAEAVRELVNEFAKGLRTFTPAQHAWLTYELRFLTASEIREVFTDAYHRTYWESSAKVPTLADAPPFPRPLLMDDFKAALQVIRPSMKAGLRNPRTYLQRFSDYNRVWGKPRIQVPPHIWEQDWYRNQNPVKFNPRWDWT